MINHATTPFRVEIAPAFVIVVMTKISVNLTNLLINPGGFDHLSMYCRYMKTVPNARDRNCPTFFY
jgi:hypothetical protein